uniref:Cytochrome c oxidase subunit 3 n=1 Tax=Lacrimia lanifica TaxID=2016125 RepID=A0A6G5ZVD4_9EUGL|nr:cytochrome c oxidase subunit 3 [Lacrimia lanifica]
MVLRGVVVHTFYVDVVTTATMYLGTVAAAVLHGLVVSTTATWDTGSLVVILLVQSCYAWSKENSQDDAMGVNTTTPSITLLVSTVLVVVSEVMLFISILWSVVLVLVAHSIHQTGGVGVMVHSTPQLGHVGSTSVYVNTLTLLNTNLLVTSGIVSIAAMHAVVMKTSVLSNSMLMLVVVLGSVFLLVQCCEYLHLYWCMYSSSTAGLLYVTTGVHGAHVLLGMVLLLLYALQSYTWCLHSGSSTDTSHGLLSLILYWHFVDLVWVSVVYVVYSGQLSM